MNKNNSASNHPNIVSMEIFISNFLRIGVITSAVIIAIGLIMLLLRGNSGYSGNRFPIALPEIMRGLIALKPDAIILTGLLLLVLTPVLRVAVSIFAFIQERDYLYVGITSLVLLVLLIGLFLGKAL